MRTTFRIIAAAVVAIMLAGSIARAVDSVVVFNEIMYHPEQNEAQLEWLELQNLLAVNVDLSGWRLAAGIDFCFPAGTIITAGGYLVVAIDPAYLEDVAGLSNVLGPFHGRLDNNGELLQLISNSGRIMDEIEYGDGGEWPVAADGSGASLAKRDPHTASANPASWRGSPQPGGTPGRENFPSGDLLPTQHKLIGVFDTWRYSDAGVDLGNAWKQPDYAEDDWPAGRAGFYVGPGAAPTERRTIDTLFSTGLDDERKPLAPGQRDPHYTIGATGEHVFAMQNHPAWLANDTASQWIGLSGQGTDNLPAGAYVFRTTFDLAGYDPATAELAMLIAVDDVLNNVHLNGLSTGIASTGFSSLAGPFSLTGGFAQGINTLEFLFANGGSSPNPSGLRVRIDGTAAAVVEQTELAAAADAYYFRKEFFYDYKPFTRVTLALNTLIDDGAVFYLNGHEVHRLNMPDGEIAFDTHALLEVGTCAFTGALAISSAPLVNGRNVLAVEVHHAAGSEDMRFAASLTAVETPLPPDEPVTIAINEITSARIAPMRIELYNYGDMPVDTAGFVLACRGTTHGQYTLPAGRIDPAAFMVIHEADLGFHPSDEDKLFLYSADNLIVDAAVVKNSLRGRSPDGVGQWARPHAETPGSHNSFVFRDEIVINEIMYHCRPVRETAAEHETTIIIPSGAFAAVRVPQDNSEGLQWTGGNESFDDSTWRDAQGSTTGVGYETSPGDFAGLIGADTQALMYGGNTSVYIRIPFDLADPAQVETLILHMKYDDGFVAYINGAEVAHANAPGRDGNAQLLTWSSRSTASHPNAQAVAFKPFDITSHKQRLRPGRNILAIHGLNWSAGSTDLLILPELEARRVLSPHAPFHEPDQEWIELYNRSNTPVDLTGWTLRGGIRYNFEEGTAIPPDGYLVVAKNSEQLRAQYSAAAVVGDFDGRLSNSEDRIVLSDSNGNIADDVHYYDGGYWPGYADGGGSSLELRDPCADNSKAAAWAASDETADSQWRTYTYRTVAGFAPGSNEPSNWSEFIIGLLQAGEVLIDNVSVIEDPAGTRIQLIQDGSFETQPGTWRLLGNHGLSRIIAEPGNPYNRILHLVATGPTEHMHNHVETTLAGGRTVVNGREYEISFRARWLAGSDQLNTRLYFNRAPKTTLLHVPQSAGTPGQRNSQYTPNMGPTISALSHSPAVPRADEDVTVTVQAEDPDGIASMTLYWAAAETRFQTLPMTPSGGGRYTATIAGLPAATLVQFYVEGRDVLDAVTTWPPAGSESRAMFKVDDNQARPAPAHNFRIIMTASDAAFLHSSTNVMSNHRMPATVIYKESEVFYDVALHLKGSGYGRNHTAAGFNVRFRPEQLFQGVHDVVSIDRNGGPGGAGASHRELVLKHIGNRAGGLPGMHDDVVHLISPLGDRNGPAQLMLARYDDAFLDAQYKNGSDGTLFEFELIYHSQNTVDGNPQSLKLPPSNVLAIDFRDMGPDKEAYRWNYLIKNNRAADDYSRIIDMAKTFALTGTPLDGAINEVIDVDHWMRVFAFESLGGVGDTYNQGLAHNLMLYVRPADRRVLALPWDLDFAFFQSTSAPIFGSGSNLQKVIAIDRFKRLFYGHLHDIIDTAFNTAYLAEWVEHYGAVCGQNVSSEIISRVDQRRAYVLGRLPAAVSYAITTNGGNPFTIDADTVTLQGNGWINVRTIRLAGRDEPLDVRWTGLTSWSTTLPLEFGLNQFSLQAYDYQDRLLASAAIAVTSVSSERPLRQHLRVTEVMHDPLGGKDYEFIELCNTGPETLDISQVTIGGGIWFSFAQSTIASIPPGGYIVVASDIAAFKSRYGDNIPVAGQYAGALANEGDSIVIRGAFGAQVLAFAYNDSRGWPLGADGPGHSLVPLTGAIFDQPSGSMNYCGNWRQSAYIHGSPGGPDPELPPGILLNEFMAHTDYHLPPHASNDWIELFNTGDSPVQINGNWYLSDNKDNLTKWALPDAIVQPGGRITFDEVNDFHNPITTGFGLDKAGEQIYLSYLPAAGPQHVVDSVRFKGQETNVTLGRFPDGDPFWRTLTPTRDLPNGGPVSDIVISEIMYHAELPARQYIELYNPTGDTIPLQNAAGLWRLTGSINYVFGPTASIPPHGRLVVADFDPFAEPAVLSSFRAMYSAQSLTPGIDLVGPFSGRLSNVTARLAVERPQAPDASGDSPSWVIVDEAIYFSGSPWPRVPQAAASVLQRQPHLLTGNDPRAWRVAPPTPGGRSVSLADLDGDGKVDMKDAAVFSATWLSESGSAAWNPACDLAFPADGIVDFDDLRVFAASWLSPLQPSP
ncbi:MAG: lamin tail domain-containing protein [Phycisphaerae bacterium]|nr:lamin tail domain-containing protein [Phycisphaerae bacterium]